MFWNQIKIQASQQPAEQNNYLTWGMPILAMLRRLKANFSCLSFDFSTTNHASLLLSTAQGKKPRELAYVREVSLANKNAPCIPFFSRSIDESSWVLADLGFGLCISYLPHNLFFFFFFKPP
jgi:hypothetical protein